MCGLLSLPPGLLLANFWSRFSLITGRFWSPFVVHGLLSQRRSYCEDLQTRSRSRRADIPEKYAIKFRFQSIHPRPKPKSTNQALKPNMITHSSMSTFRSFAMLGLRLLAWRPAGYVAAAALCSHLFHHLPLVALCGDFRQLSHHPHLPLVALNGDIHSLIPPPSPPPLGQCIASFSQDPLHTASCRRAHFTPRVAVGPTSHRKLFCFNGHCFAV
jgi:hypothetical protein